ncbi:MAG: phosphoribosyltransferase family protein [bacterium]
MRVRRLKSYSLREDDTEQNDPVDEQESYWIWGEGAELYYHKLQAAFPELKFDFLHPARHDKYDWCVRFSSTDKSEIRAIREFLHLLRRTLSIENSLDECYTLGWHSKSGGVGKPYLTALGQWVRMAKSYGTDRIERGDRQIAGLIADQMVEFVQRHPLYRHSAGLVAVPPSNPEKAFDLPEAIASMVAADCGIPFLKDALYKQRITAQMKRCLTLEEKRDNIADSIGAQAEMVQGKRLLLIDDILESGVTLEETCRALRRAGVAEIMGLIATKTLKHGSYE